VLPICRYTCRNRVRPADLLKVSRDVAVIQFRIVAAIAADELIGIGVAALGATLHEVDRLTSQDHRPAQHRLIKGLHNCPPSSWAIVALTVQRHPMTWGITLRG